MRKLPASDPNRSLVLRTDFADEAAWLAICEEIERPVDVHGDGETFRACCNFVSDPVWTGITVEELLQLDPVADDHYSLFLIDSQTFADPEHSVRVVDFHDEPGRTFRVIPSEMWGVENNLSIANMDFHEFADSTDEDGVFRGFPR